MIWGSKLEARVPIPGAPRYRSGPSVSTVLGRCLVAGVPAVVPRRVVLGVAHPAVHLTPRARTPTPASSTGSTTTRSGKSSGPRPAPVPPTGRSRPRSSSRRNQPPWPTRPPPSSSVTHSGVSFTDGVSPLKLRALQNVDPCRRGHCGCGDDGMPLRLRVSFVSGQPSPWRRRRRTGCQGRSRRFEWGGFVKGEGRQWSSRRPR
jgi:hypothetical protein